MFNLASKYKINLQNHKFYKTLSHSKNHPKKQVSQVSKAANKPIQKIK